MNFDSQEELHFSWYLDELKKYGYVVSWHKNEHSYELTKGVKTKYVKPMKRVEDKVLEQTILKPSVYTPDFVIKWSEKARGVFFEELFSNRKVTAPFIANQLLVSVVEIKGAFDRNNMTRLAVNNIKFTYEKFGVFVNMVKVPEIFRKTFTPQQYLLTDKTKKGRKIKYRVVSLDEFIN